MDGMQTFGWGNSQYAPVAYPIQWLGVTHTVHIRFLDPLEEGDIQDACDPKAGHYVLDIRTRQIATYVVSVDGKPLDLSPDQRLAWSWHLPEPVAIWISVCYDRLHMRRAIAANRIRETKDFRAKTLSEWRRMRDMGGYLGRLLTIEEVSFIEFHQMHDEADRFTYDMGQQRIMAHSMLISVRGTQTGLQGLQRFITGNQEKSDDVRKSLFDTSDRYFGKKPDATPEIQERWRKRWHPDPPQR